MRMLILSLKTHQIKQNFWKEKEALLKRAAAIILQLLGNGPTNNTYENVLKEKRMLPCPSSDFNREKVPSLPSLCPVSLKSGC